MSQTYGNNPEQRRVKQPLQSQAQTKPLRPQLSPHITMPPPYMETPIPVDTTIVQDDHSTDPMEFSWGAVGSDHLTAGTSDIGSYGDHGTGCALTDDTNSSWLVVPHHHRTYSNESSGPASEGFCHSEPSDSQLDHLSHTDFPTDLPLDNVPILEHNGHHFLQDLARPG